MNPADGTSGNPPDRQTGRSSRIRHWGERLALLSAGTAVGFLLCELILRLWTPQALAWRLVRIPDADLHHSLRPRAEYIESSGEYSVDMKTNNLGFRGPDYTPCTEDQYGIIVLGDSFTEGLGVPVESCYVSLLGRGLSGAGGISIRVFNFGIVSYSPLLEYLLLKKRGLSLNPHLVIIALDMTDFSDDSVYSREAEFDSAGFPVRVSWAIDELSGWQLVPWSTCRHFLQKYSLLYALARQVAQATFPPPVKSSWPMLSMDNSTVRWHEDIARTCRYIQLIDEMCKSRGIGVVLMMYPYGHQVSAREWRSGRAIFGIGPGRYDAGIFRAVCEFAACRQMPFLDMTPSFRQRSSGKLYFSLDSHWTASGHQVAADTLLHFLVDRKLVPVR